DFVTCCAAGPAVPPYPSAIPHLDVESFRLAVRSSTFSLHRMPADIPLRARERLSFIGEVPVAARLAACKEFLKSETAALRARHDAGASGLQITQERARILDALLSQLFNYAIDSYARKRGSPPAPVALVALGGYGRGELSPWSDVDVMFLFP